MARSKRPRKLSGTQFADSFIISKGRSVIKGFDADDGDFIGLPSDANFKVLKRKGGVLIKGNGFRTKVRGVTVAEVEDSLEVLETVYGWDQYKDQGVIVQTAPGRLIFSGKGDVFAPSNYYKDWRAIDITGEVSFPGEGMVLDGGDTAVSIHQYKKLGDIKIDGGGGKDVIHLGPPISPTDEGSIDPQNIEVLRLDNGSQRWSIDGEHPDMSVEIYAGGVQISEETRLKKITVVCNRDMLLNYRGEEDPFVSVKKGGVIDFNKTFTNEDEKLVFDPMSSMENVALSDLGLPFWNESFRLLEGNFENVDDDSLVSKYGLSGFSPGAGIYVYSNPNLIQYHNVKINNGSIPFSGNNIDVELSVE